MPDLQEGGGVKKEIERRERKKMTYALLAVVVGILLGKAKKGRR